jgi:hypothetical protein
MSATASAPRVTRTSPVHRFPRRWLAAVVMTVAALMDMIDGTIVNVALPTIRRDLDRHRVLRLPRKPLVHRRPCAQHP